MPHRVQGILYGMGKGVLNGLDLAVGEPLLLAPWLLLVFLKVKKLFWLDLEGLCHENQQVKGRLGDSAFDVAYCAIGYITELCQLCLGKTSLLTVQF